MYSLIDVASNTDLVFLFYILNQLPVHKTRPIHETINGTLSSKLRYATINQLNNCLQSQQ